MKQKEIIVLDPRKNRVIVGSTIQLKGCKDFTGLKAKVLKIGFNEEDYGGAYLDCKTSTGKLVIISPRKIA